MNIGLDCDGVVAQFEQYTLDRINKELGTNYTYKDWKSYDVQKNFNEEGFVPLWEDILTSPMTWGNLAAYPGVISGIKKMREAGHEFIMITKMSYMELAPIRERWLRRRGIAMPVLAVLDTADKVDVATRWRVNIMVEDLPRTAAQMAQAGIESYLIDRPWNQDVEVEEQGVTRITWPEFVKLMLDRPGRT